MAAEQVDALSKAVASQNALIKMLRGQVEEKGRDNTTLCIYVQELEVGDRRRRLRQGAGESQCCRGGSR